MDPEESVHVPEGLRPILKKLDEAKTKDEKFSVFIDGLIWYEQDNYKMLKSHTGLTSQQEIYEHRVALLEGMKKGISAESISNNINDTKTTISKDDSKLTEDEVLDYFSKVKSGEYSRMKNPKRQEKKF